MSAPPPPRGRSRLLELGARPWLMGIVNASPDSFSDGGSRPTLDAQLQLADELLAAGADILDIGGESATTGRPPVESGEEIERVVPLIERVAGELGAIVSVDTYKPGRARGDRRRREDRQRRERPARRRSWPSCARRPAPRWSSCTRGPRPSRNSSIPVSTAESPPTCSLFPARADRAGAGRTAWHLEQLLLDPGPDFGKTPAQTVEALRALDRLHTLGRPLLLAVSRKDFVGALTGRAPRGRLAGTLAALAYGVDAGRARAARP